MQRYFLLAIFFMALATMATAQSTLYMPRDIKAAYKNGTRSMDGKPGKNYWQNKARYNINITAMPPGRTVKGSETITYINNSPNTIRNPQIKLFINIHKPGAPRDGGADADYLNAGVTIDRCAIGEKNIPWQNEGRFTSTSFKLPEPLLPHDSVQISFDWHYEISLQSSREGMIDPTTYFLAYFYPRVAVYDDYAGWDRMNFTDGKEFYSDFNDYNVSITVPKNYVVWGTGTLQNAGSLLQPEIAKRFQQSFTSDDVIHIATKEELANGKITAQNATNTWRFTATNIPDMAFGLSDHFVWDAGSVIVDKRTNRRASVQAAYNDTAVDYRRMIEFGKHALEWLSNNWPGVPYPYEKTTIFHGYAGMEYPMMANDETYADPIFSRFVAEHEIAHTYMPFYMGINETRYGFMDEGWATAFEFMIGEADLGLAKAEEFFKEFRVEGWISDPSQQQDVPIIVPSNILNGPAVGNNEYGKAALGYLAIKDMLGDALFKKCLHEYMDRWNGKHPTPWDFFYTFNDAAGKNLNWFWNNWYFTTSYIDLAVNKVTKKSGGYTVTIDNIGGMVAPTNIIATYTDGTTESFHQTSAIWEKNMQQTAVNIATKKTIQYLKLDGTIFMDADLTNNSWKAN